MEQTAAAVEASGLPGEFKGIKLYGKFISYIEMETMKAEEEKRVSDGEVKKETEREKKTDKEKGKEEKKNEKEEEKQKRIQKEKEERGKSKLAIERKIMMEILRELSALLEQKIKHSASGSDMAM